MLLAALLVIPVGSCYRAEIDLSAFADMVTGGGGNLGQAGSAGTSSASTEAGGGAGGDGAGGETAGASGECVDPPIVGWDHTCLVSELKPPPEVCAPQDKTAATGWHGCYNGGCSVCTLRGTLPGYPYYFVWHPCCIRNDTCSNHDPFWCNPLCPPPTEHDRVAPCGAHDPNPD